MDILIIVFSGLLFLIIMFFIFKNQKIDNDIDIDKNKYKRFYGRYLK